MLQKLIFLSVCFSALAFAQAVAGLGTISGAVRDASGAGIPEAQVTVTNAAKGIRRTLVSNDAGVFSAPALVPAAGYRVTVSKPGFTDYDRKEIEVLVGQNVSLDIVLNVAGTVTTVEVEGSAPLVESTKTD